MLFDPRSKRKELTVVTAEEDPAKPLQVIAEMYERLDRVGRETGVGGLAGRVRRLSDRPDVLGMWQALRANVVRHKTEREPEMELETAVPTPELAAREPSTTALPLGPRA